MGTKREKMSFLGFVEEENKEKMGFKERERRWIFWVLLKMIIGRRWISNRENMGLLSFVENKEKTGFVG